MHGFILANRTGHGTDMYFARGVIAATLIVLNLLIASLPLYLLGLVRFFCPRGSRARATLSRLMDYLIDYWVGGNRLLFRALGMIDVEQQWPEGADLDPHGWYLVVSNHQSWADILVLQNTLWGQIPPLKFFAKRQLLWVPLVGAAMWLLGFPYVRRLGRERIAASPELALLDRQATLDACGRFRDHPTTMLSFLEGTRFTPAKHAAQSPRFQHLLNPKVGGMSYVVMGLKDRLDGILDVTLIYDGATPTIWELLQGRCRGVQVLVQPRELPPEIRQTDDLDVLRERLRPWVDALWREKDQRLGADAAMVS